MPELDFIGIATSKSATTSISKLLSEHPEICFSIPKELRDFNTYESYRFNYRINKRSLKSLDWYFKHFSHCQSDKLRGEYSPRYFIDPQAPAHIFNAIPSVKLILSFRNPISRAYSAYQMAINTIKEEDRGFRYMLDNYSEYIEKGMYHKHLCRWLKYFPKEQMHILIFDDFKHNTAEEMKRLYRFLGVDYHFIPPSLNHKFNTSRIEKYRWVRKMERFIMYNAPLLGMGSLTERFRKTKLIKWKQEFQSNPIEYNTINKHDKEYLIEVFRDDIDSLGQLLDRDLSFWLD